MSKLIVTALAAIIAASSFATGAEARYWRHGHGYHHGWHGHHHGRYYGGYWGPGLGLLGTAIIIGGPGYYDDYYGDCYLEKVRRHDRYGHVYVRRVRVCD